MSSTNSPNALNQRVTALETRVHALEGLLGLRQTNLTPRKLEKILGRLEALGSQLDRGLNPEKIPILDLVWWMDNAIPHLGVDGLEQMNIAAYPERLDAIDQVLAALEARVLHVIENSPHPRFDILLIQIRDGVRLYQSAKAMLGLRKARKRSSTKEPGTMPEPLRRTSYVRGRRPSLPCLRS